MPILPRITFGMIVLNGEPFLRYNLRSIYPFAHQIIIVEGAVKSALKNATADGHSCDETLNNINHFKNTEDKEDKVQIITRDSFWTEKDEMSVAYAEMATGDYLWQIDIDEFYHSRDIQKVMNIISRDKSISGLSFHWKNFWGGFNYLANGWDYSDYLSRMNGIRRVFRWGKNFRYLSHRPPTVIDGNNRDLCELNWLGPSATSKLGIYCYHYGMVFPKQAKEKTQYYLNMWESHKDMNIWYRNTYCHLKNPFSILHGTKPPSWLTRFKDEHPHAVKQLMNDIMAGKVKADFRGTDDIENLLSSWRYQIFTFLLRFRNSYRNIFRALRKQLKSVKILHQTR